MLQWTGGNINSALGDLTNLGTINLTGSDGKGFEADGTLDNFGQIIQTGSGNLGLHSDNQLPTTLKIEPGASYLIESDSGVDNPLGGETAIVNAGTIRKTAGSGTSTIFVNGTLTNTGTIEADSGTLALSATIAQVSGTTLTAGTWTALGGSTIEFPTGTNVTTNQAGVTLSGAGASVPACASLATNSGSFSVLGGATFATTGNLSNTGTLTVGPASALAVSGAYIQGPAGTLDIQLGGTPASGQFGQVTVTAAAALDGTLKSELVNGYAPATGDGFQIMKFASATGSFATFDLPMVGGLAFQAAASADNVVIAAKGGASDLSTTSIDSISPTTAFAGQNVSVAYTVTDSGAAKPVTSWTDSVFLSTTTALTSAAVLLGRVLHSGALAAGGSY